MVIIYFGSSAQPFQIWKKDFGIDTTTIENSKKVLVDNQGNIFQCGNYFSALDSSNINTFIIKYDASGNLLWSQTFSSPLSRIDKINDAVLDQNSNLICAGKYSHANSSTDFLIIKYSSTGNLLWVDTVDGTSNSYDEATALTTDLSNNIYIVGNTTTPSGYHVRTIKLDSNGFIVWDSTNTGMFNANQISLDNSGNCIVSGNSGNSLNHSHFAIEKIDLTGSITWTKVFNTGLNSNCVKSISDAVGNIYALGNILNSPSAGSIWVIKLNSIGDIIWQKVIDASNGFVSDGFDFILSGNKIFLCGDSFHSNQNATQDFLTIGMDTTSQVLWTDIVNGQTDKKDYAAHLVCDTQKNVFVIGTTRDLGAEFNWLVEEYDSTGTQLFRSIIDNGYSDEGLQIELINQNLFVCAGTNTYDVGHLDATVMKFSVMPLLVAGVIPDSDIKFYPQPFSSALHLKMNGTIQNCNLHIFNLWGTEILNKPLIKSDEKIDFDFPKGEYFYTLIQNGIQITSGKLICQ